MRKRLLPLPWFRPSYQPVDRAERAPKFPYTRYTPIDGEADCTDVIDDETKRWNEPVRIVLSAALCRFIALLNRSTAFQTTHTVIGSEDPKKIEGYDWATTCLGVAITIIFREEPVRFELKEHVDLVRTFSQMVSAHPLRADATGWLLGLWPEVVLYDDGKGGDIRGYGVEIRAAAFANSEARCAERLIRLFNSVADTLVLDARLS